MSDSSSPKSILIVCYSHSSELGVGGRRWNKFSSALADRGYDVTYLCAEQELGADEMHPKIQYQTFRSSYPPILSRIPKSFLEKLNYRYALWKQKKRVTGNYYDKAAADLDSIYSQVQSVISQRGTSTILISGAPFSLLGLVNNLKVDWPNIKVICDVRDPWTWGHGYGMQGLASERFEKEKVIEASAVMNADVLTVASDDIRNGLIQRYPSAMSKISVLLNGIGPGSEAPKRRVIQGDDDIILTHIGSINIGSERYYRSLFRAIAAEKKVRLRIIGNANRKVQEFVDHLSADNIISLPRKSEVELQPFLHDTDLFLMFKKDGFENSFPSKFMDYVSNRRPILAFTSEGSVSKEIREQNLGLAYSEAIGDPEFKRLIADLRSGEIDFNSNYDWSRFSIKRTVQDLEALLA